MICRTCFKRAQFVQNLLWLRSFLFGGSPWAFVPLCALWSFLCVFLRFLFQTGVKGFPLQRLQPSGSFHSNCHSPLPLSNQFPSKKKGARFSFWEVMVTFSRTKDRPLHSALELGGEGGIGRPIPSLHPPPHAHTPAQPPAPHPHPTRFYLFKASLQLQAGRFGIPFFLEPRQTGNG